MTARRQASAVRAVVLACFSLLFLAVLSGNGTFAAYTRDLANNRQYCEAEDKAEERQNTKECQSLLYRTLDDPIALLTGALFVVTFGLFLYAVRQAGAAREAAGAATDSAILARDSLIL